MYKMNKLPQALACLLVLAFVCLASADVNRCGNIRDNKTVYTEVFGSDNGHTLLQIQINLVPGSGFTWAQILAQKYKTDPSVVKPWSYCTVKFADSPTTYDCELEKRGDWAMDANLPSLKVVFSNNATYRGMDRVLINKHPHDETRFRSKLSYELLQQIPELSSVYAQFAQLTVDGAHYGFYTMLEDIRKEYLKAHDMKKDSFLYKANIVSWSLQEDKFVLPTDDPKYDEALMEANNWDVRGEKNHTVLINAYKDVFDLSKPSADVMENDFNVENFAAWLSFQFLTGQNDMWFNNYAIWAPEQSKSCGFPTPIYMLAWDNDGAWYDHEYAGDELDAQNGKPWWWVGIQYYWRIRIVQRFLMVDKFVQIFEAKMKWQMDNVLNAANIKKLTDKYKTIAESVITQEPDSINMCCATGDLLDVGTWKDSVDHLSGIPAMNYADYASTYKSRPMPFNSKAAFSRDNSTLLFFWDASYILGNLPLYYQLQISANKDMSAPFVSEQTTNTYMSIPVANNAHFTAGTAYYFKVYARKTDTPNANWMYSYQALEWKDYEASNGFGIQTFSIPEEIPAALTTIANPTISNKAKVVDNGATYNYAALDNIDPSVVSAACNDVPRTIPAGWSIALNNPQTQRHIASLGKSWGGSDLVLADGARINAKTGATIDGFGDLGQHLVQVATATAGVFAWGANCSVAQYKVNKKTNVVLGFDGYSLFNRRILITDNTAYTFVPTPPPVYTFDPTKPPKTEKTTSAPKPTGAVTATPRPSDLPDPAGTSTPTANGGGDSGNGGNQVSSATTHNLAVVCVFVVFALAAMLL